MQLPKITATGVPQDIAAGLATGCYLGQVRHSPDRTSRGVLYASAEAAPDDLGAYFEATYASGEQAGFFRFDVTTTSLPVWVRAAPVAAGFDDDGSPVPVEPVIVLALAKL